LGHFARDGGGKALKGFVDGGGFPGHLASFVLK
jgi:hypothetical protein